ncbi:MAG TPA: tetratricopeptide repeat protein [Bacteroidales bacterium]|nr:tetratricopeptide repeat protein [Bacteroidales bacterium]
MKTVFSKRALLVSTLVLMSSLVLKAQNAADYGSDPETCKVKLSTYTEFFKQENYKDAYPAWKWCYTNCPASTKNLYIHGPTILDYMIEKAADKVEKEKYIDSLLMIYDQRIQYYGEEGRVKGRKANDILKYRPDSAMQAYKLYVESIGMVGNKSESSVLGYFTNVTILLFKNGSLPKETVVENYATVSGIIEAQIAETEDSAKREKIRELGVKVEEMFVNSGAADCDAIVSIFTPKFEANPNDIELQKKIAKLMEKTRNQDCLTTDLYAKVSEALYNEEKTPEAAHKIAKVYFLKNNYEKAEFYYLEAAKLQSDESLKADLYYELASLYLNLKQYSKARDYARRALGVNANYGKAYLVIAKAYAAGGGGCGENEIDKVAIYWVVVDQLIKAKNADATVADDANDLIRKYTSYFPTREKLFWYNVTEGQSYTVGCWVSETTTVRCID